MYICMGLLIDQSIGSQIWLKIMDKLVIRLRSKAKKLCIRLNPSNL